MKIVLDTNVLISGIFWHGLPRKILNLWKQGRIQIVLTPNILTEYRRVCLEISKKFPNININSVLDLLTVKAEVVSDFKMPHDICKDIDDIKFIACALASKTSYIVSGDKHLLQIKKYQKIKILTPKKFVELL